MKVKIFECNTQKQAHLQTAQANTQTKVCKRACFSPDRKELYFFPYLRCFNFSDHTTHDRQDNGQNLLQTKRLR